MLFLTDVDHVNFEKANKTQQNNLQSATVSLQVVIGLCKRKENGGSENQSRRNVEMAREDTSALRRFFSFAVVRQNVALFFTYMLYGKFADFIKI